MSKQGVLLWLCLLCASPMMAGFFWGDNDTEIEAERAEKVADLMREPRVKIAEAQLLADEGKIEDAIAMFREAQTMIEKIESENDTSDVSFASLRLTKFHCISMLDDLILRRVKVNDTRQAVTDTSDLEARLKQEREALKQSEEAARKKDEAPKPPTLQELLPDLEAKVVATQAIVTEQTAKLAEARQASQTLQEEIRAASQAYTRADGIRFIVETALRQGTPIDAATEAMLPKTDDNSPEAKLAAAEAAVATCKQALDALVDSKLPMVEAIAAAERSVNEAKEALKQATVERDAVLKAIQAEVEAAKAKALAEEKAKAEAAEAERKRLAAEELKRQQAAAAAAAKAKAEALAKQKELETSLAWCEEMWHQKRIDTLEKALAEVFEASPNEPRALILLAKLRILQGRAQDALELVAFVPDIDAQAANAQVVAAAAYVALNRPMEAMSMLELALKSNPTLPAPYMNMATVLMMLPAGQSQPEIAEQYYRKAVELGAKRNRTLEKKLNIAD